MIDEFLKQNYEPVYLPGSKLVLYWIRIIKIRNSWTLVLINDINKFLDQYCFFLYFKNWLYKKCERNDNRENATVNSKKSW